MSQRLAHIALLVRDYDEAIAFFVGKLGFNLLEDTTLTQTKRWVRVSPDGTDSAGLLLARAVGDEQVNQIGYQSGGRVMFFLYTDSFEQDHSRLLEHDIEIVREPVDEAWGRVLVFADLYGNQWDLIQPRDS